MKDYTEKELKVSSPKKSLRQCLYHCLPALYNDKDHYLDSEIVHKLTFEELIGTLLLAEKVDTIYADKIVDIKDTLYKSLNPLRIILNHIDALSNHDSDFTPYAEVLEDCVNQLEHMAEEMVH